MIDDDIGDSKESVDSDIRETFGTYPREIFGKSTGTGGTHRRRRHEKLPCVKLNFRSLDSLAHIRGSPVLIRFPLTPPPRSTISSAFPHIFPVVVKEKASEKAECECLI